MNDTLFFYLNIIIHLSVNSKRIKYPGRVVRKKPTTIHFAACIHDINLQLP